MSIRFSQPDGGEVVSIEFMGFKMKTVIKFNRESDAYCVLSEVAAKLILLQSKQKYGTNGKNLIEIRTMLKIIGMEDVTFESYKINRNGNLLWFRTEYKGVDYKIYIVRR